MTPEELELNSELHELLDRTLVLQKKYTQSADLYYRFVFIDDSMRTMRDHLYKTIDRFRDSVAERCKRNIFYPNKENE